MTLKSRPEPERYLGFQGFYFVFFLLQVFKLREIRYSFSIRVYMQSPADNLPSRFLGSAQWDLFFLYHIPAFDILVA